jgi:hypothetical protein
VLGLVALGQAVPQRFRQRQGRQETGYLAPAADAYGAPSEDAPALYAAPEEEPVADASELDNSYLAPAGSDVVEDVAGGYLAPASSDDAPVETEAPLDSYGAEDALGGYESYDELDTAASDVAGEEEADPLKMLMNAVPGVPGEDYPIFTEAPETAFSCDGQIDGGKKYSIRNGFNNSYLLQAITLMKRPNAKCSTFAQLMVLVVWPSTVSSAPTEPSSTRTTSSATGGSMLIVLNQLLLLKPKTLKSLLLVLRLMLLLPLLLMKVLHQNLMEHMLLLKLILLMLLPLKLLKMLQEDTLPLQNTNMKRMTLKLLTVTLRDLTKEDSKNVP